MSTKPGVAAADSRELSGGRRIQDAGRGGFGRAGEDSDAPDIFFGYPVSLLAATSVFVPVLRAKRIGRAVGALAALAMLLLVWEGKDRRFPYIDANDSKAAIQFLAGHIRDEDGLIVYPHANWALAYYGKWPYRVIPDDRVANNFSTMILRDRTLTLPSGVGRIQYWNHPDVLAPFLEDFASREIPAIYYLSTLNPIDLGIAQLFHNHAYRIDPNNSFGMFTVTKFVKVHGEEEIK